LTYDLDIQYMFLQNFIKLSAVVHDLLCWQEINLGDGAENNAYVFLGLVTIYLLKSTDDRSELSTGWASKPYKLDEQSFANN